MQACKEVEKNTKVFPIRWNFDEEEEGEVESRPTAG
jgi:hypothetical protein